MSNRFRLAIAAAAILVAALPTAQSSAADTAAPAAQSGNRFIDGQGNPGVLLPTRAARSSAGAAGSPIIYHGGPIMPSVRSYIIWYGNWAGDPCTDTTTGSTPNILTTMLAAIGGSAWYGINTHYTQQNPFKQVLAQVSVGGCYYDTRTASLAGINARSGAPSNVVQQDLQHFSVGPPDASGLYYVFTSADVAVKGFGTNYCGYHGYFTSGGVVTKYSFVGDPSNYMSACAEQTTSPSGNAAADAMVSVIAHELVESASDPQLNAWYDKRGYENADKCAWTFGATSQAGNGSLYNMTINTVPYLIQQNWSLETSPQSCQLS